MVLKIKNTSRKAVCLYNKCFKFREIEILKNKLKLYQFHANQIRSGLEYYSVRMQKNNMKMKILSVFKISHTKHSVSRYGFPGRYKDSL